MDQVQFLKVIHLFTDVLYVHFSYLYLVHQGAVFYNLTLSDSKYSALLLAQEWLERHCFNGTKVQWFSLMHGNGCQQAFSCCTTIRALSLVGGWLASNRTELQCCQVSHITYEVGSTYPFPKYQGGYWHWTVNAHCIFKIVADWQWGECMTINFPLCATEPT